MAIKNLTAVAASAAALITLGVAGMPEASASVPAELVMNGTYRAQGTQQGALPYLHSDWQVSTKCSLSGNHCTQTVKVQAEYGPATTAQLENGKYTFSVHSSEGYICVTDSAKFKPGTRTFTYDNTGGTETDVPDPGVCKDNTPMAFPFSLTQIG